nr:uncharacterized protein LOC116427528 [Nomia melanderi]
MASRKRIPKPNEEHLYMLEVFVDQVNFLPEKPNVNVKNLTIFARFADLPEYNLTVPSNREQLGNSSIFKSGKSCLFAKSPTALMKTMKVTPLRLDVYHEESRNENKELLSSIKVALPACMCDHVSKSRKETNGAPPVSVSKNDFDLTDPSGQACGSVSVVLRLSCFGSSIVKRFLLNGKSFMLEDSPVQKFLCPYLTSARAAEEPVQQAALKRPASPPRVSINDPGFKDLTTAEKLNDPKFRELVYRAYPDEPTCCCQPADRSTGPMECRSGCKRPCCMKLRDPESLARHQPRPVDDSADTYCVNNYLTPIEDTGQDCSARLRGGGDIEQIYLGPAGYKWPDYDTDCFYREEQDVERIRLEGGGENRCGCSGGTTLTDKSQHERQGTSAVFDACKPRLTSTGPRPGCTCAGKDTQSWHTGVAKCSKQPCLGIDCLIRAFKETQQFVDSIGKVPGLPGLGLMDPSESPYFGRDIDKDYLPKETGTGPRRKEQAAQQAPPPCHAPCNRQAVALGDDRPPLPYTPPAPLGAIALPPRLGIVREAIPVLPDVPPILGRKRRDEKKSDEKADKSRDKDIDSTVGIADLETGPCGEPMCKSRRKTQSENLLGAQSATVMASKSKLVRGVPGAKKQRAGDGKQFRGGRGRGRASRREKGGAGGDYRFYGGDLAGSKAAVGQGPVRVSKRVMRYVYFVGDHYPGINYGHRDCIDIRMRVPANMGWLWNTLSTPGNLKPRIGWRPGAIGRHLYGMLQEAKDDSQSYTPEESASATTTKSADRGRTGRGKATGERGRTPPARGRPGVERARGGAGRGARPATVDRNRVRSASARQRSGTRRHDRQASTSMKGAQSALEDEEAAKDPPTLHIHRKDGTYYVTMYPIKQEQPADEARVPEPMKPLQFKIVKNKDEASVASSSTASDMEIEFSPPAAVTRPRRRPDVIHVETQVRQQEILDAVKVETAKKEKKRRERKTKPESGKKGVKEKRKA